MKNKTQISFLWITALLFATLACRAATRLIIPDTPTPVPSSTSTPTPPPSPTLTEMVKRSCPSLLTEIMEAALDSGASDKKTSENLLLVDYTVTGDQIHEPYYPFVPADLEDEQSDQAAHEALWNYFAAIIPAEQRTFLVSFLIRTDGTGNVLAEVSQIYYDLDSWELAVDIRDSSDYYKLTATLLHEFGHLLTLNSEQVPPSGAALTNSEAIYEYETRACPQYYPGVGCSNPTSYINLFHQRFWTEIYDDWKQIDRKQEEDVYYQQLYDFYYKHNDQFLTNYAATSPSEDIAESWTLFVLSPKPEPDSISMEKILFFHEYPELVGLRSHIRKRICAEFPQ